MRAALKSLLFGLGMGMGALAEVASDSFPSSGVFFVTENSRRPLVPWSSPAAPGKSGFHPRPTAYHWAAFTQVLDDSARARLALLGVEVLGFAGRPGPYQLYKVRVGGRAGPAEVFDSLKGLSTFVNLLPILPEEKMNRGVFEGRFRTGLPGGKVKATIYFHRSVDRARAEALLEGRVDSLLADNDPRLFHVVGTPERVLALAEVDEVSRVEDYSERLPLKFLPMKPEGPGPGKG